MKRRIAVVTSSRADYCHLRWPLHELAARRDIDLRLIVLGPHLSPEFGESYREIERDGFRIDARVECLLSSDSDVAMAKTIGIAAQSLADVLGQMRPDLLLVTADRYEMLAPAVVANALRIPLAHIEGGEISEGAIDDAIRNALTKLSHVHFTSTPTARRRVIAMGEEPWRVHHAGAPSLDHLRCSKLLSRRELEIRLGIRFAPPTLLVIYHPTTIARNTTREAEELFAALEKLEVQTLFCYPNADAGSRGLIRRAQEFVDARGSGALFVNLEPTVYWSLLKQVDALAGNSSSGIMEAASFGLPVVDVGIRQRGRERGRNVISVEAQRAPLLTALRKALSPKFRASLLGMKNLYGDGKSSARIAKVLATVPLGEELLIKRQR